MAQTKEERELNARHNVHEVNGVDVTYGAEDEKLGNEWDQQGMVRMGKRQELRREFQFFSIWGFAVILGCSWEYVFVYVVRVKTQDYAGLEEERRMLTSSRSNALLSLPNGGTAGTVWVL